MIEYSMKIPLIRISIRECIEAVHAAEADCSVQGKVPNLAPESLQSYGAPRGGQGFAKSNEGLKIIN